MKSALIIATLASVATLAAAGDYRSYDKKDYDDEYKPKKYGDDYEDYKPKKHDDYDEYKPKKHDDYDEYKPVKKYGDDYDEYKPIKHDDYDEYKPVKKYGDDYYKDYKPYGKKIYGKEYRDYDEEEFSGDEHEDEYEEDYDPEYESEEYREKKKPMKKYVKKDEHKKYGDDKEEEEYKPKKKYGDDKEEEEYKPKKKYGDDKEEEEYKPKKKYGYDDEEEHDEYKPKKKYGHDDEEEEYKPKKYGYDEKEYKEYESEKGYFDFIRKCGKKLFLTPRLPLKFAEKFCHKHGGELAELNIKNFDCISTAVRKEGIKTPVWIESWNGDNYRHAGIALFPAIPEGAIAIPRSKKNPGLCELKKRH